MAKQVEFQPVKGYELINEHLGQGAFGQTVLIRDPAIDELFVCKKYMPVPGIDRADFFNAFKKEIKLMYNINHPNVVRVFTYYLYEENHVGYIIMEYIDGESIDQWFSSYYLKQADSNDIFRQLINGFACIENSGIIHRDIRESNILISNNDRVKIIDFGLGKDIREEKVSLDSYNTLINRAQMIEFPREFEEGKYTNQTDMFCLAELFSRMLKKYDIRDFKHNYILKKMMSYAPEDRYESFNEILKALDKKDFKQLDISDEDKEIYNKFVDEVLNCISVYTKQPIFERRVVKIIDEINEILENNCLNYYMGDSTEILRIFIRSPYRYYSSRKISVTTVNNFLNWLLEKDEAYKQIVINNIINRLTSIPVRSEEELPF